MKCSNCGAENPEGKIFCADCGWRLFEPSPHNLKHVVQPRLGRVVMSIALGLVFGYLGMVIILLVFGGGLPSGINLVDPVTHGDFLPLAYWLLASLACALFIYGIGRKWKRV